MQMHRRGHWLAACDQARHSALVIGKVQLIFWPNVRQAADHFGPERKQISEAVHVEACVLVKSAMRAERAVNAFYRNVRRHLEIFATIDAVARTLGLLGGSYMKSKPEELSFTYFPENYRWSHGLLIGLNMAPWGGAEIGEVNRIGLRLKNRIGDDDAWFQEWSREARTVEERGRERIDSRRTTSGAQYLQRASAYYHVGERFLQPKALGLEAYRRGVEHLL